MFGGVKVRFDAIDAKLDAFLLLGFFDFVTSADYHLLHDSGFDEE